MGSMEHDRSKLKLQSKLVSFYSYKDGVGKTTSLVMAAISLARQGKRIAIVDLDLGAPGVAALFPRKYVSKYGALDFITECGGNEAESLCMDEYVYPVSDICKTMSAGGEIYIVPAAGSEAAIRPERYLRMMRDFDMSIGLPLDAMLEKLDAFLRPDMIFIDASAGISKTGGLALSQYSDLALLFFHGSQQHVDGMHMVLPYIKKCGTPFLMVNAIVPANNGIAAIEEKIYIDGAYSALSTCHEHYKNGEVSVEDKTAEHYPIDILYNPACETINNTEQLLYAYDFQKVRYGKLASSVMDGIMHKNRSE